MKIRKSMLSVGLVILFFPADSIAGQALKKEPVSVPSTVEPLRVIGGELDANTVTGQVKRARSATTFSFTLTKAEIVSGRLQIAGDFALHGARTETRAKVVATIGGVMSKAANPWPNARQSYAQSGPSTACNVLFLKLTLPRRLRARIGATPEPLQLGVVLQPLDNQRGEDIVKEICLLASQSPVQEVNLNQLNRLLVLSK